MKIFKIIFGIFLIIVFGFIYWKNSEYMTQKQAVILLEMNYTTPALPNWAFFLILFAVGFLVAWFFGILYRMSIKKTVKNLNRTIQTQKEKISELEGELELLQGGLPGSATAGSDYYEEPSPSSKEIIYTREGKADGV